MRTRERRAQSLSTSSTCLLTLTAVAAAVALRWLLDPWLGQERPFVTLFAAVAVAALLGGWRAGAGATIVGYAACDLLFIEPRGELGFQTTAQAVGFGAAMASSAVIVGFGAALRRAQTRTREQHELLRLTLASIGDAVVTTDMKGRLVTLNPVAEELTGWAQQDAAGRPLGDVLRIVNEETGESVENPAARALREGNVVGLANHTILIAKDGTRRPIDDSAAPIRDEQGDLAGCVMVFRDVAERRAAEHALARSEQDLRDFFDNAAVGLHWVGSDGKVLRVNRAELELLGYAPDEYVGHHIAEFHVGRTVIDDILRRLAAGEAVVNQAAQMRCKDGSTRHVLISSNVLWLEGKFIHTRCFTRDVTEQKLAEEALREADRRKDEFLATLAHELRNPIAPVRNSLEIMKRRDVTPQLVEEARDTMDRQVTQMERLIDDLLDISRITRNRVELRRQRVELASVVHTAIEASRPLADARRHDVHVALPSAPIVLDGDPTRLAQIFGNLLNNACKYTEPGGHIELSAELRGVELVVSVKDDGIGIAADILPRVFDGFTQADCTLEKSQGGLGIGLTLVKQLTEMHAGRVEAASGGPGRGAVFHVHLPVAAIDVAAALPATDPAADRAVDARKILVVDDNEDGAESLALLLRLGGHVTATAYDGLEAVEVADRFQPDVVLLDIGLPRLNGFDVCRKLRERPWGASALVIALSGWGQDGDRRKSKEAGFDAHLVKPLDHAVLTKLLASAPQPRGELSER
ncbi:MAG: PAS domain S-box protein [Planctomycetota bacterium]